MGEQNLHLNIQILRNHSEMQRPQGGSTQLTAGSSVLASSVQNIIAL
jgi:hypothetical protein